MANLIALQMVSEPDIEANFTQLEHILRGLSIQTPTLVVLPECFAYFGGKDKSLLDIAEEPNNGPIQSRLTQLAKAYGVWLVAGTIPLKVEGESRFTASSLLINDKGDVLCDYQKIHLFDVQVDDNTGSYQESKYTKAGTELKVIETPFGRLGMCVCYDIRFAGMFNAMAQIDVLVVPAAFTQKTGEAHWHSLLQARAIENQCYVVAANQGGEHANGRQTFGHSCIISPWGKILAEIDYGAGSISSSLDFALCEQIRTSMPVAQHNKFRSHLD
ncbi:carbon-nitrogen hydrolase family protein [Aestuariibacter sp. AA17]|uniref:Carbon-nitrogen hydrolase family protein n=1 Tax=Fluctibacter corallii TaxID=2984329 RepID=A0ABT3AAR7_9ALTE|nr:carbon-nitrogen hydrolase family protein [Aestuariibacter sp. AA17]MCV2885769.1 carbon-nitrogen hydrolase family protein [Aestuariibacter sp. AA17]